MESATQSFLLELIEAWLFDDLIHPERLNLAGSRVLHQWFILLPTRLINSPSVPKLPPGALEELEEYSRKEFTHIPIDVRTRMVEVSSMAASWLRSLDEKRRSGSIKQSHKDENEIRQEFEISQRVFASGVTLSEPGAPWTVGFTMGRYSEDPYSKSFWGRQIYRYKYAPDLSETEKARIEQNFSEAVWRLLRFHWPEITYPDQLVDSCLAIPPNNIEGKSLPMAVCRSLATDHVNISDLSSAIRKTRHVDPIKRKSSEEKTVLLKDIFSLSPGGLPLPRKGILVIDDVYDSGITVRTLCGVLRAQFPEVPILVIVFTHTLKRDQG